MDKLKFYILNKYYYPHKGGVETTVLEHANLLSSNLNFKTTILVSNEKSFSLKKINKEKENLLIIKTGQIGELFSMPISLSYIFYFFNNLKKDNIIFLHEPWPLGTLCLFLSNIFYKSKIKSIVFWHADTKKIKLLDRLIFFFQKKNLEQAKYILVSNKKVLQESIITKYSNLNKKILELPIPFIKPTSNDKIDKNLEEIEKKIINKQLFFFFGRLVKYKGIEVLLDSLSKIEKDKIILIAGIGPLSKKIVSKSKKFRNVIFFNRFLNENEKSYLFQKATAFLFPSINNSETLGITQIEALSFGCPVINTNLNTAVPYVSINDITGKTIEANNHEELSNAINKFPNKKSQEWKNYSVQGKNRFINNFSKINFEKKFIKILKNLQ